MSLDAPRGDADMAGATASPSAAQAAPILIGEDLSRAFADGRGSLWRRAPSFNAVEGVSIRLRRGETLGIVGESGCGKSTLGRLLAGLLRPTTGQVRFDGVDLNALDMAGWRATRRRIQVIFQDAPGSLDPRLPVDVQVAEPLDLHRIGDRAERRAKAAEMLDAVKLGPHLRRNTPSELSGGQQQRVVIARALMLEPDLLICDEPVSALDVSIQAQIITLLMDLRARLTLSMIFISHDLAVMRQIADRVGVMHLGQIVEEGPAQALFEAPRHPYTRALLAAAPIPDPVRRRSALADAAARIVGEPPSPQTPPPGCRFHTRCPMAEPRCRAEAPRLAADGGADGGRAVACHFPAPARAGGERP